MSSTAGSAVILYDHALRITETNPAARALLGEGSWTGRLLGECLGVLAGTGPPLGSQLDNDTLREHARSRTAFAVRIGSSAWRAELSPVSAPETAAHASDDRATVGALILREVGEADDYRDFAIDRVDFMVSLSHDLRTPLNAMVGWLHLLSLYHERNPDMVKRAITGLRMAVEQQRQLLSDRLEREHKIADAARNADSRQEADSRREADWHRKADAAEGRTGPVNTTGRGPAIDQGVPDGELTDLSGVFVLAIDDKPEMLEVLTQVLEADGAAIETAASADEALQRYPQWASSGGERLLISDLAMPGRDGFSLIREIRGLERQQHMPRLPAVALSAHGLPDVRRRAIENGYDLFLDKPVDPPVLLGRLHRLLAR